MNEWHFISENDCPRNGTAVLMWVARRGALVDGLILDGAYIDGIFCAHDGITHHPIAWMERPFTPNMNH